LRSNVAILRSCFLFVVKHIAWFFNKKIIPTLQGCYERANPQRQKDTSVHWNGSGQVGTGSEGVKGERFSRKGRLVYGGIIPTKNNRPNPVGHRKSPYELHRKGVIL